MLRVLPWLVLGLLCFSHYCCSRSGQVKRRLPLLSLLLLLLLVVVVLSLSLLVFAVVEIGDLQVQQERSDWRQSLKALVPDNCYAARDGTRLAASCKQYGVPKDKQRHHITLPGKRLGEAITGWPFVTAFNTKGTTSAQRRG